MGDKLREALERAAWWITKAGHAEHCNESPYCHEPEAEVIGCNCGRVAMLDLLRAALAADDAARGTMREAFEAFCPYKGSPDPWVVWQACWQAATRAAALPCGHPTSLMLYSAETGEPLYCELCDDKSGRADAERMESELSVANESLRQELAALKVAAPQGVEPVDDNDDELPGMWSHSDLTGGATDCVSSPTAPTEADRLDAWIACSERMPEPETDVLCWVVDPFCRRFEVAGLFRGAWYGEARPDRELNVTHWRPLPAQPAIDAAMSAQAGGKEQGS